MLNKPRLGNAEVLKGKRVQSFYLWKRNREYPSMTTFDDIRATEFTDSLHRTPGRGQGIRQ